MEKIGTWQGKTVIKISLDEYCALDNDRRLRHDVCFLIGDILHMRGWKIGEVHGNSVTEWSHPVETEYSENEVFKRSASKKRSESVEVPQAMSDRADYPVTIGVEDFKNYSKVVDEFFEKLDDNFNEMLARLTIDLEGWK